jgi:hypothetical protein
MADQPPYSDPRDALAAARGQSLERLLEMLEGLDGAEEAQVVRQALAAGVPRIVAHEEVQREVERRLLRTRWFYDEQEW